MDNPRKPPAAVPGSTSSQAQVSSPWNPFDRVSAPNLANGTVIGSASEPSGSGPLGGKSSYYAPSAPTINVPASGGALKSVDEKLSVNPVSGTCQLSIPFAVSPGRNGHTPSVAVGYDSGGGNGPFGLGWSLSLPYITRKTANGIPRYDDSADSDVFLISGAEDLVPKLAAATDVNHNHQLLDTKRGEWVVREYWPRTEGAFTRIEKWSRQGRPQDTYWKSISAANVTSFYGQTPESRIYDVETGRIFSWLLCDSYDSCGNATRYVYKAEDGVGVRLDQAHEQHRGTVARTTNRYIKSILYGNARPNRDEKWAVQPVPDDEWLFEITFDYGDHSMQSPTATPDGSWTVRGDPFSTYAASFEIRTYRRCRRILLFHHFKELKVADYLVRSMDLTYTESGVVSILTGVTQSSHVLKETAQGFQYLKRSLPPIELTYSKSDIESAYVKGARISALPNLPSGLSPPLQWVDLDGVGKASPLLIDDSAWYSMKNLSTYKANYQDPTTGAGDVIFGPLLPLVSAPSTARSGTSALLSLDGSGRIDVVHHELGQQGYYERNDEGGWTEFRTFASWPTVDQQNPNLRFLDLTGNGLADIIIAEADAFLWYPALGTTGYGEGTKAFTSTSEDDGPRVLFSDGMESIYLADFTGDGLTDLIRIRNGDVCYWPNIGYGRFGAKVTMDNAPWMDPHDRYCHGRVLLADIDGSGPVDMLYFPPDGGLKIYLNKSGNSWSLPVEVSFPLMDSLSTVNMTDLFGIGTSCVVWSSKNLGIGGGNQLQYLDFTHGLKPHLLTTYKNGPLEKRLEYTPSTTFYQSDEVAGRKWPTRLPFPLHCLSRLEVYDHVGRTHSSTSYGYHDGYFDGLEREFRGFGKVEITSSEHFLLNWEGSGFPSLTEVRKGLVATPPTLLVTWYHTGWFEEAKSTRLFYRAEYYTHPVLSCLDRSTGEPLFSPVDMTNTEIRQSFRALKGTPLHQETFLLDGSGKEKIPCTVIDTATSVRMLQRASASRPGVFIVVPRESVTCQLERDNSDPRINHQFMLETDNFGNVKKAAVVSYGRRVTSRTSLHSVEDWEAQATTAVLYTESEFTNEVYTIDEHHTPLGYETRAYEVKGLVPAEDEVFVADELSAARILALPLRAYTDRSYGEGRRMISRSHTRYRSNDLSTTLGPGVLESLAMVEETYTLSLTPDLISKVYGNDTSPQLPLPKDASIQKLLGGVRGEGGGLVDLESNNHWWVPSGKQRMTPNPVMAEGELQLARSSFFLSRGFSDPFGSWCRVEYDDALLFPVRVADALGNTQSCVMDYRVLQPRLVEDENGNKTSCAFDALGTCVGVAVMGQSGTLGDTVDGFQPDVSPQDWRLIISDPPAQARRLLAKCTSITFSDFASFSPASGWRPALNIVFARDTALANLDEGTIPNVQMALSYFDSRGQKMQTRTLSDTTPGPESWVVSNVILKTVGDAVVRQWDNFFSRSHDFGWPTGPALSTNFYDHAGRLVASVMPNRTWMKTVYTPWSQTSYDPSDTVLVDDPLRDVDVGRYLSALDNASSFFKPTWYARMAQSPDPVERRTAELCRTYADTPSTTWSDVKGQPLISILDNGVKGRYLTRTYSDVQGNVRRVMDSEGRLAGTAEHDMLGGCIHSASMDTGRHWEIRDVYGKSLCAWNSRGVRTRTLYDELRRPVSILIKEGGAPEFTAQTFEYGEGLPDAKERNMRGKVYRLRDQAAISTSKRYDHHGNAVEASRQLVAEYKAEVDWSRPVRLEAETYTSSANFDAIGRLLSRTAADDSVVTNSWSLSGLLASVSTKGIPGSSDGAMIKEMDYNARGQLVTASCAGSGTMTQLEYEPSTFILRSKTVTRKRDNKTIQDLRYSADCACRIVRIDDLAQQSLFFRGSVVRPVKEFTYDAIGRLVRATGREHLGQTDKNWVSVPSSSSAGSRAASPSDGKAMAGYIEEYTYSPEGNILALSHALANTSVAGWTRTYTYQEPSLLEPGRTNNRLSSTTVGDAIATYRYEGPQGEVGLVTSMTGFPLLRYDAWNQLAASSTQAVAKGGTPETTWYRYDTGNKRVRKLTERYAALGETPSRSKDHMYLGDVDIFRKWDASGVASSERWSWHVYANDARVALAEAERVAKGFQGALLKYAVSDHTSSVSVELDSNGEVISMEEYSPFGATVYDASAQLAVNKSFRFAAKARDVESGLYYFENRYLVPWLGRWLSPDPLGTGDGINVYCYVRCDPINRGDPSGLQFLFFDVNPRSPQFRLAYEALPRTAEPGYHDRAPHSPNGRQLSLDDFPQAKLLFDQLFLSFGADVQFPPLVNMLTLTPGVNGNPLQVTHNVNTPTNWGTTGTHAEEASAAQGPGNVLPILAAFISKFPCSQSKYHGGHRCLDMFTPAGGQGGARFVPLSPITPVFFYSGIDFSNHPELVDPVRRYMYLNQAWPTDVPACFPTYIPRNLLALSPNPNDPLPPGLAPVDGTHVAAIHRLAVEEVEWHDLTPVQEHWVYRQSLSDPAPSASMSRQMQLFHFPTPHPGVPRLLRS